MFTFLRRIRARLKYRHFERDLAQEIDVHRTMKQEELEATGVAGVEARTRAARALGNTTLMREDSRSIWIARWIEHLGQDLRYAARGIRRQPGFALTIVGVLGLTAGLLTTLVVFADATMLRPWRVPDASRLVLLRSPGSTADGFGTMRIPEYFALRDQSRAWNGLAMVVRMGDQAVTFDNGAATQVKALGVSGNYFETLGVTLAAGRGFASDEDAFLTPARVVIISTRLWKTYLSSDPGVIGRQVRLGQDPFTIIGIAPAGFIDGFGSQRELWVPASSWIGRGTTEGRQAFLDPKHQNLSVEFFGRLAEGVSIAAASAELHQSSAAYRSGVGIDASRFDLYDTRPINRPGVRGSVSVMLMVATALLLVQLLACANVGNMLLARALGRRREIAVRLSLGADRSRLVRQMLVESGVLVVLSLGVALAMAALVPSAVWAFVPDWDERPEFYSLGLTTLYVLLGLSAISTIVAGLAPALRSTRVGLSTLAGDRHGLSRDEVRLRRFLLAAQITLATILLSGAGLLTRAVGHAMSMDPGFALKDYQEVTVAFPPSAASAERRAAFYQRLLTETQRPDWPPIAIAERAPIFEFPFSRTLRRSSTSGDQLFEIPLRAVSDNYLEVLRVPILAGRMPRYKAPVREMALNRRAAELLWPGKNALGRTVMVGDRSDSLVEFIIVGLVPDLPTTAINVLEPVAYWHTTMRSDLLIVRSADPEVVERLASLAANLEPGSVLTSRPLTEMLEHSLLEARISGWVAGAIGAFGLLLATIGAFGVFAYAVEARKREVGIRMALGARASQVVGLVLRTTQTTVIWGIGIGMVISAAASPLLRAYLYGLSPFDPVAYLQVAAILAVAAAIATWIPARRATRVNPAETLRAE